MAAIIDGKDLRFDCHSDVAERVEKSGLLDLVKRCDLLYQQAFYANAELAILFDLKKLPGESEREVICAPCFFSCARIALADSCFMNCARLLDRDGDVTIRSLLKMCAAVSAEIDARAAYMGNVRASMVASQSSTHWPVTRRGSIFETLSGSGASISCSEIIAGMPFMYTCLL